MHCEMRFGIRGKRLRRRGSNRRSCGGPHRGDGGDRGAKSEGVVRFGRGSRCGGVSCVDRARQGVWKAGRAVPPLLRPRRSRHDASTPRGSAEGTESSQVHGTTPALDALTSNGTLPLLVERTGAIVPLLHFASRGWGARAHGGETAGVAGWVVRRWRPCGTSPRAHRGHAHRLDPRVRRPLTAPFSRAGACACAWVR